MIICGYCTTSVVTVWKYVKDAGASFSGVVNVNVIGTGERYSAYLLETAAPGLLLVDRKCANNSRFISSAVHSETNVICHRGHRTFYDPTVGVRCFWVLVFITEINKPKPDGICHRAFCFAKEELL